MPIEEQYYAYGGDVTVGKIEFGQRTIIPEPVVVDDCVMVEKTKALDRQEGGDHYKTKPIQPVEYCMANGIGFMEGSVIKYVTRWKDKGGVGDLKKARHFLDLLIEWEVSRKS